MKPHLLKIALHPEQSFTVRNDVVSHFYNKWHYHPELELIHIIKGSGRQFIGDNIHHFKDDDMILLGANLPHLWRSDEKFLKKKTKLKVEAILVHFLPGCLGDHFFRLPENKEIARLLEKAQQGVRVKNNTKKTVAALMHKLLISHGSERIILLLQVLRTIAHSKETKPVCSKDFPFPHHPNESDRMNTIYQYIMDNFSREISLEQIAGIAHLSPHAFCRYFKSRIKKTFSRFLMEVRIGHACKLLAETHKTVAAICFECGFNNFSNFNRHFKSITDRTPLAHRKYYQEIRQGNG
ncbi:AraC family transcriptional regulator [Flavitalea flava]